MSVLGGLTPIVEYYLYQAVGHFTGIAIWLVLIGAGTGLAIYLVQP
jgi:hypothetical protein